MRWLRWNWLDQGLLPLLLATIRFCWLWPWLILLRQILARYVPRSAFERPKMGFGVPIDHWLRGPLRGWAEHLLDESRLRQQGLLNPAPIRERWKEHLSGTTNWAYPLWDVLMLNAWLEANPGVSAS